MASQKWNSFFIAILIGCAPPGSKATADVPIQKTQAERITLLEPRIVAFVEQCDQDVLSRGRALTAGETLIAAQLGVAHPDRVRILVSRAFPEPDDPKFAAAIDALGPSNPIAETTGYGIQLTPRAAASRRILRHELTHVVQFERFGTAGFMHIYLGELTHGGYGGSALEAEAKANEVGYPKSAPSIVIQ
jgi:hypothetical protein